MRRALLSLVTMVSSTLLGACAAQVSDLDELEVDTDACDPRGAARRGTDFTMQFVDVTPHVNQNMFFAVTVGEERSIEAMMVLSTFDDPDLRLFVPKLLPAGPSELAFWADSEPVGTFDPIPAEGETGPIDHQWTRPICPDGRLTFTHTTPFQDVQDALSTGAIFQLVIPEPMRRAELFDNLHMWVTVTQLDDRDQSREVQTRAYFRWAPQVAPARGQDVPEQRPVPTVFQVGGNALGEPRGAIDKLSFYNIEFVIDVDGSGGLSNRDFVCRYERQRAPDQMTWMFEPDLDDCDAPSGFDLATFEP